MGLRDSSKRRRTETTLEITPLIDVVFLLLLFFLITATFSQQSEAEIPVDLPEGVSGQNVTESDAITLYIQKNGKVDVRTELDIEGASLQEKLKNLRDKRPETAVLLRGDQSASHGRVVEVLDLIKQTGFSSVNLMISRESSTAEGATGE
jgi:biopolymer transport protein ExbD